MPQQVNPFDDIVQPQPRSAIASAFQHDPFGDDDPPGPYETGGRVPFNHAEHGSAAGPSHGRHVPSTSIGGQHGYALDPFFDEYV